MLSYYLKLKLREPIILPSAKMLTWYVPSMSDCDTFQ